ncbi:putative murein hydrolase (TIGR00659 family) [Scopulibacillus daqui]|uniref:Murein hydrolase (TIGR00659 family) n=1 Tax=Scopulibacillus daqui TaxID=1469162 RepID=A0ABS2Q099_9BACL|nr:LrgB family protein [Scopulibacillus daqui]MBM7645714.1 putative murein hydrolase (TIGR00659 family) [Scopulibacillus daqui]
MTAGFISFIATVAIYYLSKKIYQKKTWVILSPLLIAPVILVALLSITHTTYKSYSSGGQWLTEILQPATVAFAVPLYKYRHILKKQMAVIALSMTAGVTIAFISSDFIARLTHVSPNVILSMLPRSVTTPIAMAVSINIGGIPAMTAAFVIMTGITGIIIGPLLIKWLPINDKLSKGLLLGMGAHGAGTSKALEIGKEEGAAASLAMVIAAVFTLALAPVLMTFLT